MSYTTSDLLDSIKRRSFAPDGQDTFSDTELLAMADEVLLTHLVPDIIAVKEEFFVVHEDEALAVDQAAYDIPVRAAGGLVRDVWLVDGTSIDPNFRRKEPEEVRSSASDTPDGFYLKGNQIIVDPPPSAATKTLRKSFFLTPSKHVATSAAGVISAIDTDNLIVTVSSIPSTWATGDTFDLIRRNGGQEPLAIDLTSTLVSGSSITLPSLPANLAVGDYVALAGETPLVQVPDVFRTVLAQGVAAEILESTNQPGADKAKKKFEDMRTAAQKRLTPRVQGEDRMVKPVNWF